MITDIIIIRPKLYQNTWLPSLQSYNATAPTSISRIIIMKQPAVVSLT
jgi:hypothetical protein